MNLFHCSVVVIVAVLTKEARGSGVAPLLKLNDGHEIPSLGLGTWLGFSLQSGLTKPQENEITKAVEWAIDAGYRHIDTAHIYENEDQVGLGINKKIAEGVVKREELFITTKLWNDRHAKDAVVPALRESLQKLNLEYVDLYLIHWPIALLPNGSFDNTDYLETWQGMIEAKNLGLTKSIGLSNFNQQMIERILSSSPVKPAVLQVEINLNLQQPSLLAYCRQHDILVTGYTPFGSLFPGKALPDAPPPRIDDPELVALAAKYNKTVTQVTLRYLVELGVVPIPKSATKARIEENIDVFDFELAPADKDLLRSYDKHYRTLSFTFWSGSPFYPFEKN